jgi:hypothetical protein
VDGGIVKTGVMPPVVVPAAVTSGKPKKLLEQMRDVLRIKHYSLRTERSYCDWVKRFIRFHGLRHPKEMDAGEISQVPNASGEDRKRFSSDTEPGAERAIIPLSASPQAGGRLD